MDGRTQAQGQVKVYNNLVPPEPTGVHIDKEESGSLTISLPAPCRPWLVQTADSPSSPPCQSASCRRTGKKQADWRRPTLTVSGQSKEHETDLGG